MTNISIGERIKFIIYLRPVKKDGGIAIPDVSNLIVEFLRKFF